MKFFGKEFASNSHSTEQRSTPVSPATPSKLGSSTHQNVTNQNVTNQNRSIPIISPPTASVPQKFSGSPQSSSMSQETSVSQDLSLSQEPSVSSQESSAPLQEDLPMHSPTSFQATPNPMSQQGFNSKLQTAPASPSSKPLLEKGTGNENSSVLEWGGKIIQRMNQSETIESLFNTTVTTIHQYLQADRVLLYRFQTEKQGIVVAESMVEGYTPTLNESLPAIAFGFQPSSDDSLLPFVILDGMLKSALTPYQAQLLERFQVKSSLSLPIWLEGQVWGLLVIQQCSAPRHWQDAEVTLLNKLVTELRLRLQPLRLRSEQQALARVSEKIRQTIDISAIFELTTREVRKFLDLERVAIYQFNSDYTGDFVYESKLGDWLPMVGNAKPDSHLQEQKGGRYRLGEVLAIEDIYTGNLSDCQIRFAENFEIKAAAIAPIFQDQTLWGLLCAYQHSSSRQWAQPDIQFLTQISNHLGIALQRAQLLEEKANAEKYQQEIPAILNKISSASYLKTTCETTVKEIRQLLGVERVVIYKFRPDYFGDFIYESEVEGWPPLVGSAWEDTYVQEHKGGRLRLGEPYVADDIYTANLSSCHISTLEHFGVKSFLIVPIKQGEKLWGLLSAFQHSSPRHWLETEIKMLIEMGRHLGASLERVEYLTQLQAQADQMTRAAQVRHAVTEIIPKILQSQSLEVTFQVANQMIRRMLKCDRVAIHRFNPDWSCTLVAESAARGVDFLSGNDLEVVWPQIDLQETQGGPYRNHETLIVNNIHTVGYSSYEIEALEDLELKAFVVVPIFKRQQLWGVLGAYQTTAHRSWTEAEISALNQIAIQISVAMQQLDYLEQLQQQSEQLAEAAEREKLAKEKLQQEVMHLLLAVRPALDGDLTVRVPVTENEVGTIADVYNNTLGSLRQIVSQMLAASNQVTQTSQASEAAIAKLTLRAQEQCETLNEALEQVQIVRFSARTVESNAAQVNAAVQQAKETVTAGDTTINRTVDEMENIQETVVEASERLQRLSESFQKISRVVNLISNFTTQTQLLALNASIEATRAGEYGRGFAVVANEVRSLARQSADAAIEIDQLVQEIQGGLTEVSTAMQTGMQHVVAGTTVVMDARQNLNAIVDTTTQISQLIAGISQATHDQSQQCQSLTETMTEAAFLTDQTAEESKAVSTSFKDLLTMAEDLQAKSQRFKVH